MKNKIVFVCEHGAAKSIIAATYFNKLAKERGLDIHAIARGTNPDEELSPKTIIGLQEDGLIPNETIPLLLSQSDLDSAQRIITFCELPQEYRESMDIEDWSDVPPVSENYVTARDAILQHMQHLFK